jgi:hypothetical protein
MDYSQPSKKEIIEWIATLCGIFTLMVLLKVIMETYL